MYRRLKNLLGVSLILLSLLVSQIPMPEVVADEAVPIASEVEVTAEVENEVAVIDDATNSGTSGTDPSTGTTTPTTSTTVTVTFDYRMPEITNEFVTVNLDSGIAQKIEAPTTYYVGESVPFGTMDMVFNGWYKDTNAGEKWDFDSMMVSQDITLYAQWVRGDDAVARVTYSATEVNYNKYVDVKLGDSIPKPTDLPERAGYEVDYWVIEGETTEVNWDQAVKKNITLVAVWKEKTYTVTLDFNGAKLAKDFTYNGETYLASVEKIEVPVKYDSLLSDLAFTSDYVEYDGVALDDSWYKDSNALAGYDQTQKISNSIRLYKRVVDLETQESTGFEMNLDGTVLYHYKHPAEASDDVLIPATVKIIGENAFDDLNGIRSITLPAGIEDIRTNAFSGALSLSNAMTVYSSGTTQSMSKGKYLANLYEHIVYQESATVESTAAKIESVNCSLYESNTATGENRYPTYVTFLLPVGIEKGTYSVSIAPNDSPVTIDGLLAAIGITDANRLYHMEIDLQKDGRPYSNYSVGKTFTVILPVPQSWQNYGMEGNTTVYTVSMDGKSLEALTPTIIMKDGIKCVKFEPYHFSEYVVYYGGSLDSSSSGNGGNSGGSNTGGNNNTGSGSNTGGSSNNNGSSNSGSNNSGGGNSGSGNSGNSSSNSSNVGNNGGGNSTTTSTPGGNGTTGTPVGTTTDNAGAGQGQGAGHVKDSTPKTGDPLEYRTMAVCILFSMGVIILLIGNEKKERVSRASRVLRG